MAKRKNFRGWRWHDGKSDGFAEVSVVDDKTVAPSALRRASLVFGDFTISLEGRISTNKLISLLQLLGG